ncbi:MAG TPA: EAL domain-containing protein [Acidimicrobiia bacterium]|nr:EAL domain-containing protein [Acidimicrobiia bacterium]
MPPAGDESPERAAMESDLRVAVEHSQFTLHYQPLVSLADGHLVAFEALLRWESELGPIVPGRFVPVLEEAGLIVSVGTWVLEEACRQAKEWEREFPRSSRLLIAVNVSSRQLDDPGFAAAVMDVLEDTGMAPTRLCLEITETATIKDAAAAWAQLRELKALGVRLSIDDFGTAQSSLSFVKTFQVDMVKIDRSFVAGIGYNAEDEAIVTAVVQLAHALGIETVAEGVETAAQLAALSRIGCDQGQGYHFNRPGPPGAIADLLRTDEAE